MRAVAVNLDAGIRFGLGIGVAAEMSATLQHQYPLVKLGSGALGHGQAEEARTNNDQVMSHETHDEKG